MSAHEITRSTAINSLVPDAEFSQLTYPQGMEVSGDERALLLAEGYTEAELDADADRWLLLWQDARPKPTEQQILAELQRLEDAQNSWDQRLEEFNLDAQTIDLINRMKSATPQEIDQWLDDNVSNTPQVRAVLKAVVKVMVVMLRPR